jgi:hypothetical protein
VSRDAASAQRDEGGYVGLNGRVNCVDAEQLAGTIALNEASDSQREAYRGHLAGCTRCVRDFGGERDIERVMGTVAQARSEERWQPALRALTPRTAPARGRLWAAAVAAAIVVAAGLQIAEHQLRPATAPPAISTAEARALAALGTQNESRREGRAESLAVGSTAAATLNLRVNARGVPLSCTIAQSSGDGAKDGAICRAAMQRRYSAP